MFLKNECTLILRFAYADEDFGGGNCGFIKYDHFIEEDETFILSIEERPAVEIIPTPIPSETPVVNNSPIPTKEPEIETAKANNLRTYHYLKYLLEELPNYAGDSKNEIPSKLLPWSEDLPAELRKSIS